MWLELDCSGRQNKSDPHFLRTYGNQGTSVPVISTSNTASFCKCRRFQRKKLDQGLMPQAMDFCGLRGSLLSWSFFGGRSIAGAGEAGPDGGSSGFESGR